MAKILKFEYKEVKEFRKEFRKRTGQRNVDKSLKNICNDALENTTSIAKELVTKRTKRYSGELEDGWGDKAVIQKARKTKGEFVASATNKAFNPRAKVAGKDPYYASFVEEGHAPVPWRASTHAIHALSDAELDTERKLQKIVDNEVKKFFGGLFS